MGKCCVFQPETIAEADGITTITLEHGGLDTLCKDELFAVALTSSIPNTSRCNRIVVTDGTTTKNIAKNNQYFRPEELPCGCNMILCNKTDPETVAVFCRYTAPRGCC